MAEDPDEKMQGLLTELAHVISVMNDHATANSVERVEFLGGYIHFGTKFDQEWHYDETNRYVRHGGQFHPAIAGPLFNNEYWSESSFDCWPTDAMREWQFGPNRDDWRKSSYEEE